MFFSTLRRAVRREKEILADRDFWKKRALALQDKLDERTDFFVEREFRIVDRFFTSKQKTYAITDEIRTKQKTEQYDKEAEDAALEAYLQDKKDFLIKCAREAGLKDPEDQAARDYEKHRSQYVIEFQQGA